MTETSRFTDRSEAGKHLAGELEDLVTDEHVIVYGLLRGGVPVAYQVALALEAPLDVIVVRKLGVPGQPELAMGAVASGDVTILDDRVVDMIGISDTDIERIADAQRAEVRARQERFSGDAGSPDPEGVTAVVVDDGMATGSTMRASVQALRQRYPERVVVAVPVASRQACAEIEDVADEVVCLSTPEPFSAVGVWYDEFEQVRDEDVVTLLETARDRTERIRGGDLWTSPAEHTAHPPNSVAGSPRSFFDDPEWRALSWGVGGAVALVLGGLIVGLVQGNLLPGDCQGLACLFTTVVLGYAGSRGLAGHRCRSGIGPPPVVGIDLETVDDACPSGLELGAVRRSDSDPHRPLATAPTTIGDE